MRFMNDYPYRRTRREDVALCNARPATTEQRATSTDEYASMSRGKLLHLIDTLTFVKGELELYLDAYPDCRKALADYRETVAHLERATTAYEENYAPLWASGAAKENGWSWVKTPWPWHYDRMEDK